MLRCRCEPAASSCTRESESRIDFVKLLTSVRVVHDLQRAVFRVLVQAIADPVGKGPGLFDETEAHKGIEAEG